ncbi:MAG: shikimate kinase [Bacteroidales bacterium]|nr:shikimate kinase [Bacteroidales bacterium]MDZ4203735.1 shikimate kinase [Bacteroidales bacterium]
MRLFIIGYMGSGKTTLGKRIAQHTGWPLVDLDNYFEETYRTSIPLFFERYGETTFRDIERQLLLEVAGRPGNCIVSTGGGTPSFFDNMQVMKRSGQVIYIKLPPSALASRLYHSPLRYKRPILKGLDKEGLLQKISLHLKERESFYEQADLTLESLHLSTNEMLNLVFGRFTELERK